MSSTSKMSSRERIENLLDDNSFVEIGSLVRARNTDFNMAEKETPADGVVTGYGLINGEMVYVYSQDKAVLGGSIGEMHAKKIVNIYDMALKMGAPVIGLVDCAGLRLEEATDALNAFGEIYLKQSLASGVIPQITAVFGNCGGGLAVVSQLSDFVLMEDSAKLFVNSPNVIDGNYTEKCDSASAKFQSEEAGNVDYTGEEADVLAKIRDLVGMLPANCEDTFGYEDCTDDLNRACTGIDSSVDDVQTMIQMVADNGIFFETKKDYATDMVTGLIKLNGNTVGVVANNADLLTSKGAVKAAEFVNLCDAFSIPVVSFTNVTGYDTTMCEEKKLAKATAKLTYAFANATTPKVNVITANAIGSAYVVMNSKSIGADMVYAWSDAKIGMMNAESAAKIIYADEIAKADNANEMISNKADEYNKLQLSVDSAAARGYVDTIIEPEDTRKYLIGAVEMLLTKREERPAKKHGTV
ncbi:MAG: carboxyl transferase [Lachnospiraceae bacterium]|nr:carboxyl transferase [Lachnospiraceae bacterium]